MAKEALGPGTWENLTDAERLELVEKEVRRGPLAWRRHMHSLLTSALQTPCPMRALWVDQIWKASVREEWLEARGKYLRIVVEDDEGGKINPEVRDRSAIGSAIAGSHPGTPPVSQDPNQQQQQLNRKQRRTLERQAEKKKDK